VPPTLERSLFVWAASLLLTVVCVAWQPLPGSLYQQQGALAAAHLAVVGFGVLLTALGARVLDPLELAGIRQALHQRRPGPANDELVTHFPYNLVRHPIYLGWVLIVFGVPHMTVSRLLMAVLSTGYLVIAVPWEERLLVRTFGPAYEVYRRQVRWRIVPFLY
jgi:protein-S-isoprenylcysteine O-methyltransferase Ste14